MARKCNLKPKRRAISTFSLKDTSDKKAVGKSDKAGKRREEEPFRKALRRDFRERLEMARAERMRIES